MKRIFIYLLIIFGLFTSSYAIDLDNIQFTEKEFIGSAVTKTDVIELSNGRLAVAYRGASNWNVKVCDIDGTNCNVTTAAANAGEFGVIVDDPYNERIILAGAGSGSTGYLFFYDYDGTSQGIRQYNTGATKYVDAVVISSTQLAVNYMDDADGDDASMNICPLSGAACAGEKDIFTLPTDNNKVLLTSDGYLKSFFRYTSDGSYRVYKVDLTGSPVTQNTITSGLGSGDADVDVLEGSDNRLKLVYRKTGTNYGTFIECDVNGAGCGSEVTYLTNYAQFNNIEEINSRLFVVGRNSSATNGYTLNMNLTGGTISAASTYTTYSPLYVSSVFTTDNQLIAAYDENTNNSGVFAVSEVFTTAATITINSPTDSSYLDNTSFLLNVTTDLNTNLSYSLNGASFISLANNSNSTTKSLIGVEGINNLSVKSNLTGEISYNNISFTIDTINPTITNNIPSEINNYEFNGSSFSCSDTNLDSCNISIQSFNYANGTDFNLTFNGNWTYNITATDLAGNSITENGTLFINPFQYFYFQLSNGTPVTQFYLNDILYNNFANIKLYDIGLGSHNLTFEKLGYATTNISVTFNTTSAYNLTTNITQSKIVITIYDRETLNVLTGLTEITLVATVGFNTTTTTGFVNITDINFLPETYQGIFTHAGYATENVFFTYNNQENLPLNIYMLNQTSDNYGTYTIQAIAESGLFIKDATCTLLEWRPSSSAFVGISQGLTDVDGKYIFSVELNTKSYKTICTYNGITASALAGNGGIITSTGQVQPLYLIDTELDLSSNLENIAWNFTNSTLNSTHSLLIFTWVDTDGLVTEGCINLYNSNTFAKQLISSTCSSGSSSQIQLVTQTNNSFNLLAQARIVLPDDTYENLDELNFKGYESFETIVSKYNLDLVLPILFFFLSVGFGLALEPQNIYIALITLLILEWVAFGLVPTRISFSIALFISVIDLITLWGVYKASR